MSGISGFNFKQAFGREKPHSSVTDWVEILTGPQTEEESYEGMPELVDAIGLQSSGPSEAARALRKKMKHGGSHQQHRSIVIMRLLLDNIPEKMKHSFSESQFLDVIKGIRNDSYVDKRVKKRMNAVLITWQERYKDDPSMSVFAGMYGRLKGERNMRDARILENLGHAERQDHSREREERAPAREERNKRRDQEGAGGRLRRRSFNFERDKPKIMGSIVDASQASSNLMNAIMLVNLETDTLETNQNVQSWLAKANQSKKIIMRYAQLVENEELIGTLIETHERLETAINAYAQITATDDVDGLSSGITSTSITDRGASQPGDAAGEDAQNGDVFASPTIPTIQQKDKSKNPYKNPYSEYVHPDLADLDFVAPAPNLPAPMKPKAISDDNDTPRDAHDRRGSLSDYSDYESSDEQTYIGTSKRRGYVTVSDDSDDARATGSAKPKPTSQPTAVVAKSNNPFADAFAA